MNIKRIEIEFGMGNIDDAFDDLKQVAEQYKSPVFGLFNGKELTSSMSIDEAYKAILGKTKDEYEKDSQAYLDRLKQDEENHKKNIPTLEKEWMEKAKGIIREDKLEKWNSIVPIRLGDLYRGMELGCTLKLVEMLDINRCSLDEAKDEFYNQGHSGMSAGLMFCMMREFCIRGEEFVEHVK